MTSSTRKISHTQIELTLGLDKDDLGHYLEQVQRNLASQLTMEGFRRGRVPFDLAKKRLDKEQTAQEALSLAVDDSLSREIEKQGLNIVAQEDFKILENSKDKLVYRLKLTIVPAFEPGRYKNLKISKREALTVADSEVEKLLAEIAGKYSTYTAVSRGAEIGDKVEIDFWVGQNGKAIEGGQSQNHPLILGQGRFVPGFEDQIVGMAGGQSKKFQLKMPADYYQKNLAGRELDFEVTLNSVEQKNTPPLDDQLAAKLGGFNSLEELKKALKQNLLEEKNQRQKEGERLEILEKISRETKVEIPEILIQQRLESMIESFDNDLHQKSLELSLYLAQIGKSRQDLEKDWRQKAGEQVKRELILMEIGRKEGIEVSREETEQELTILLERSRQARQDISQTDPKVLATRVGQALLTEKIFQFLEKANPAP